MLLTTKAIYSVICARVIYIGDYGWVICVWICSRQASQWKSTIHWGSRRIEIVRVLHSWGQRTWRLGNDRSAPRLPNRLDRIEHPVVVLDLVDDSSCVGTSVVVAAYIGHTVKRVVDRRNPCGVAYDVRAEEGDAIMGKATSIIVIKSVLGSVGILPPNDLALSVVGERLLVCRTGQTRFPIRVLHGMQDVVRRDLRFGHASTLRDAVEVTSDLINFPRVGASPERHVHRLAKAIVGHFNRSVYIRFRPGIAVREVRDLLQDASKIVIEGFLGNSDGRRSNRIVRRHHCLDLALDGVGCLMEQEVVGGIRGR